MNKSEGLRYRLEDTECANSFNSTYLISTWYEPPYLYLKSESSGATYRFNMNTEKLYKWVQAYTSWDTMENKLIPVTADSMQQTTLAAKQNEYVHFGD